jgi:hypothetical protein
MKIRRMLAAELPIVLRIAMSRVFSMTSSTSDAIMLSAATITIKPIVIEVDVEAFFRKMAGIPRSR